MRCLRYSIGIVFCTLLLTSAAHSGEVKQAEKATTPDHSIIQIAPYAWLTGLDGTLGFGEVAVDIDLPVTKLADQVEAGGMGFARWQKGDYAANLEILLLEYKDQEFEQLFNQRVSADLFFVNAGIGHVFDIEIGDLAGTATLTAGVNYTEVSGTITGNLGAIDVDERWLDPTIGLIAEIPISANWTALNKTDLAGLGISENTLFTTAFVAQRRISKSIHIDLGYRYASAKYPSPSGFSMDLQGHGPLIGVSAIWGLQEYKN